VNRSAPALLLLVLAPLGACKRAPADSPGAPAPSALAAEPSAASPPPAPSEIVLDVLANLDGCAFGHRGALLDFGDPSMQASLHPGWVGRTDDEAVEHEGATWLRARSRAVTATFYWPGSGGDAADASAYVEARVRGAAARAVAFAIDGKAVGSASLVKGEARVVLARASTPLTLGPGGHELSMRFIGGSRASTEPLAEIDWVHVGTGDPGEPYAAPTRADVTVDAAVGGKSLRALSLRAPGFVRCSGWIPANATVEVSLATAGGGEADVEARLLRDRRPPVVLGEARAARGDSGWAPWSVPITGLDGPGALASLELVVRRATRGTRVLLGEPRVVAAVGAPPPAPPGPVRSAVLVVLGSESASALAPWGGAHPVPELTRLASGGTTFLAHRAVSSLSAGVMASMLTGLPPLMHHVDDPDSRLPQGPITIEEACRQAGIATAMFTANPTTGDAFGFGRGWDDFVVHDPLENVPSTRVFDDAAAWIEAHKAGRFLVVVHARGGHPPWDATPDELKTMAPDGYLGIVEPRRAAEALAKVRKHPGRFKDEDRVRAWALYNGAIDAHDAALGRLMAALRATGREDDSVVIVTGDVAASEAPVPFGDVDGLDEALLATPLVVRWPGDGALAGRRVDAATSPVDVATTVLDALGLAPPSAFRGADLASVALGRIAPAQRPLVATRAGRFSVRWGPDVLVGARDREARMCDLSLDPACIADVRATSPLALELVRRRALEALAVGPGFAREPIVLDDRLVATLARWGRLTGERDDGR
jgi:arylsulfatase A-like enzyme